MEVKSRNKHEKHNAKVALKAIEKRYKIKCELVSYEELLLMYKELPFSLTSTITEWIQSDDTTIHKAAFGELNGHYKRKHSNVTKKRLVNTQKNYGLLTVYQRSEWSRD